jgi:glycosyltransferase involved in cell wall biosynthesis
MARLVGNAALRRTLVERGYIQAQKFSWQACASQVLSVLEAAARL